MGTGPNFAMRIAVIGAGPAGCRASGLLSQAGHEVRIFDARGPWEKPCGGGVTARALGLGGGLPADLPKQEVERITAWFGDSCSVSLEPTGPLGVVSRKQFGEHLLAVARAAGADFVRARVSQLEQQDGHWILRTRDASFTAEYVVGADGATSMVRRKIGRPFGEEDLSVTLGYFIRGRTSAHMKIFFIPGVEGYIWSFPRRDHISYGLITRPGPNWTQRGKALLENYILADLGPGVMEEAEFYSAPVPRLRSRSWASNRISGPGWGLIGDAAGLADPITGEGIYFALRSAHILAETFPAAAAYQERVETECFRELESASKLYRRFYSGRFLGGSFQKRMIQMARRSPTIRGYLGRLVSGSEGYRGLRGKLLCSAPRVAFEMVSAPFRGESPGLQLPSG